MTICEMTETQQAIVELAREIAQKKIKPFWSIILFQVKALPQLK